MYNIATLFQLNSSKNQTITPFNIIQNTTHNTMPVETKDEKLMFSIIRASFNQRRKTLANGLKNSELLHFSKEEIEAAITACGWLLTIRGEALNLQEFARLTDELCK